MPKMFEIGSQLSFTINADFCYSSSFVEISKVKAISPGLRETSIKLFMLVNWFYTEYEQNVSKPLSKPWTKPLITNITISDSLI